MFSSYSKTDVLAIRYVNDFICIGLGSALYIVNKLNHKSEVKLDVLYPDRIHGIIEAPDNKLVIFGGKSLRICKLDITSNPVKINNISKIYHFTDWIIAAECSVLENVEKLIILFAHNNLYICDLFNEQHHNIWCEEKCILYGGTIYIQNYEDIIVFSGTVFQEILIWNANTKNRNDAKILHRLKGHNGVIFSVFYDPFTNLISSTSDDRTVRLWGIDCNKQMVSNHTIVEWNKVHITLKVTMYGHTARVWRAIIKDNTVVSIGEDSQICLWSINGQFLKKIQAHHGSPIWCVDVSSVDERMLTGAADGSIYAWPFPFINEPENCFVLGIKDNKTPKFVCYLSMGTILVIKDDGEINSFDSITHQLNGSYNISRFSSYLLMQVSPDRSRISLGSKDGFITIYQEIINEKRNQLKCQVTEKIIDSKIFSIQWLNNENLLVCGSLGRLNIVRVTLNGEIMILSEYILPESRERWVTAAVMYENLLICGDRAGSIFVFKISPSVDNNDAKLPIQTFNRIHGKLGIQSCFIKGIKLITTGRDGQLRFYEIRHENGEYFLELECAKNMPIDWINKIVDTKYDEYAFGFSEIDFIVYSMSLRRILIRIPCGGGHRSWDCVIIENILKFVFIKDKKVHSICFPLHKLGLTPLVEGYHTKEILSLKILSMTKNSGIFISGSEDCSLRISQGIKSVPNGGINKFQTLDILDGHISNVKSLAVFNLENAESYSKNLVFSGGGRAQLKVWQLNLNMKELSLSKKDLSCKLLDSFMLRGTDKERKKNNKGLKMKFDIDPETRYMDINVYSCLEKSNLILLFVACSDGYLRTFSFNTSQFKIKFENALQYNRCILKVYSFTHDKQLIVLTMATDGVINFWNFSGLLSKIEQKGKCDNFIIKPFTKLHIHQSGINSYDVEKLNSNDYLLATGGDDNLLSLTVFNIIILENEDLSVKIKTKWSSVTSHYTQITGIKLFKGRKLYSVGTDQKVVVHKYFYTNDELSVFKENEIITCVSDVQGVTFCESDDCNDALLCTYGKGFEFIVDTN